MESMLSQSMVENRRKLHIVMFPWLAFGHMIPFLNLAKLIAQKGHKITFISTPRNIDRLPKPTSPLIDFVKIPLPKIDNLPTAAESTTDLPYHKIKYLKIAQDGLRGPISEFLRMSSPDWVFFDFAPYWLPEVAAKLNISSAYFNIFSAATLAFLGPIPVLMGKEEYRTKPEDFTVPPRWIPFETTLAFRVFEVLRIFSDSIEGDDENITDLCRFGITIKDCDLLVIRSCLEFQPEWLQLVQELHQKPIVPVGLLPVVADTDTDTAWIEINDWLNKHDNKSVVYVAFGSEATPSQEEITEIAHGLELSEIPFFWVLRKQAGRANTKSTELPPGLVDRIKGRGVVWRTWAPQIRILSHDSVGGFFNHAGWGSALEGIQFGLPLIMLTTLSDTGLNARILEEKKLGYAIPRDEFDGSFSRTSVAESLRLVMIKEEGEIYREKAKEMSKLVADMSKQDAYIDKLLDHLQSQRCIQK